MQDVFSLERPMTPPSWTDVVSTVITVLGFVAVIVQLRSAVRQLEIATVERLHSRMQAINEQFLARPHLRPFFYGGQAIGAESETHSEEIRIMAEMFADFFEEITPQLHLMDETAATASRRYIADMVRQSPALRAHFREHAEWYSSGLLSEVEA
jgi:hypothetical protein